MDDKAYEREAQWRRELEEFKRDINLVQYARELGYELERRRSSVASKYLRGPNGDKILVARDRRDDHWVYCNVHDERDNGTVVDFVQNRRQPRPGLAQVRQVLRDWLGRPDPVPAREDDRVVPVERDRLAIAARFEAARAVASSMYLEERGLCPEVLSDARFNSSWRQDARGNILFVHRDLDGISGYEVKNRQFTGFSPGGTKGIWHSAVRSSDRALVIAESAIDALSYHQLHPRADARYLSIGGTPTSAQLALLERAVGKMPAGSTIIAAVDADRGGDLLYNKLERAAAQSHVRFVRDSPTLSCAEDLKSIKDWNDVLQQRVRTREHGLYR